MAMVRAFIAYFLLRQGGLPLPFVLLLALPLGLVLGGATELLIIRPCRRYLRGVAELTGAEVPEDYTLDVPVILLLAKKGDLLVLVRQFLAEIRGAVNRSES